MLCRADAPSARQIALALEPLAPVAGALLREQHVQQLIGVVLGIDGQLHQAARLRRHGGLAQLRRAHLAESLEARHHGLDARVLCGDALQRLLALRLIERVDHLLAGVDAKQRRHAHVHVPGRAPADGSGAGTARTAASRCAGRRCRRPRGCRSCDSAGPTGRSPTGSTPMATLMLCTSCDCSTSRESDFPGIQDLAAQRHDGLGHAIARLLGRAAGRVALDQEQLAARRILVDAVGELARQRRPRDRCACARSSGCP